MEKFDEVMSEILEVDIVNSEDELATFECWDSLTILSIIAFTDQKYHVSLSAADVVGAKTIGGLKEMINKKMK
jgi:acyl carrier protein